MLLLLFAGVSAVGAIYQGMAASKAAKMNAEANDAAASATRQQAQLEAQRQRVQAAKALGAIRTGYAASGVTLEGNPLDVLAESAYNAEIDNQLILKGGEIRAQGFERSASLDRQRARNAETSGYLSAAGSLLGGAAGYGKMTQAASVTD